jgi:hypothetical protein
MAAHVVGGVLMMVMGCMRWVYRKYQDWLEGVF